MPSRYEQLLEALLNGKTTDIAPQSRSEELLLAMINGDKPTGAPQSRNEAFLMGLAEQGNQLAGLIDGTVTHLTVPGSVTEITDCFAYNISKATARYPALQSLDMPNVATIGAQAFECAEVLKTVNMPNVVTIKNGAFAKTGLQNLIIPDSVTTIEAAGVYNYDTCAFGYCLSLETVVIGKNVQELRGGIFWNCTALKTVTFRGTPTIGNQAGQYPFADCSALTDIYVPWAEGEVSGAPWGATNATIHYNHKEG